MTIRSPWEVVAAATSSAVRRLVPERWVIDLLMLALAALVIGATALRGLAVVSTWTPLSHQPTAGRMVRGGPEGGPVAIDVCSDRQCCEEIR